MRAINCPPLCFPLFPPSFTSPSSPYHTTSTKPHTITITTKYRRQKRILVANLPEDHNHHFKSITNYTMQPNDSLKHRFLAEKLSGTSSPRRPRYKLKMKPAPTATTAITTTHPSSSTMKCSEGLPLSSSEQKEFNLFLEKSSINSSSAHTQPGDPAHTIIEPFNHRITMTDKNIYPFRKGMGHDFATHGKFVGKGFVIPDLPVIGNKKVLAEVVRVKKVLVQRDDGKGGGVKEVLVGEREGFAFVDVLEVVGDSPEARRLASPGSLVKGGGRKVTQEDLAYAESPLKNKRAVTKKDVKGKGVDVTMLNSYNGGTHSTPKTTGSYGTPRYVGRELYDDQGFFIPTPDASLVLEDSVKDVSIHATPNRPWCNPAPEDTDRFSRVGEELIAMVVDTLIDEFYKSAMLKKAEIRHIKNIFKSPEQSHYWFLCYRLEEQIDHYGDWATISTLEFANVFRGWIGGAALETEVGLDGTVAWLMEFLGQIVRFQVTAVYEGMRYGGPVKLHGPPPTEKGKENEKVRDRAKSAGPATAGGSKAAGMNEEKEKEKERGVRGVSVGRGTRRMRTLRVVGGG